MASDILPKLAGVRESHGGPPGLYLLGAAVTFWPGSLVLVFALVMAWRRRRRPAERFLLAWLVPTWLFFECLPTKLPGYVLPTFPALALLAARAALTATATLRPPPRHAAVRVLFIGWALLTVLLGLAPLALAYGLGASRGAAVAALPALAAVAIAAACLRRCWRGQLAAAAWTSALAAAALYAPLLHGVLPRLDALWPSRAAAAAVARVGAERPLAAVGCGEPSLVFLTRADIALLDATAAAAFLADRRGGLVLVSGDQLAPFAAAARERGIGLRNLWSERGVNYTTGKWVDLQLFAAQ
jgi:4-amino-4-deoxy-L-arabinose transferase-like glycosyltransferase